MLFHPQIFEHKLLLLLFLYQYSQHNLMVLAISSNNRIIFNLKILNYLLTDICKTFSNVSFLQAKCPSAIKFFDDITTNVQGKTIVMFLDYDGTLTAIVKNPERAFMSEEVSLMSLTNIYMLLVKMSESS